MLVRAMVSFGRLDHPVERSSHTAPTPKGGGVGIVAAYVVGVAWLAQSHRIGEAALMTAPAALFLGAVSYLDDILDWPFMVKLAGQLIACLAVMAGGAVAWRIELAGHVAVNIGAAGWVLTLGWLLFVTNAVNFIDGLNGLASGSIALAALALAAGAAVPLGLQAGLLVAGIAGFLPFNYPKARIFMGDVGSQVCGLLAATLAVQAASVPSLWLIVPLALVPILADVAITLVRRAWHRQKLTQAHRGHLYQVANRSGVPAWAVTLAYWGMASWGGLLGLQAAQSGDSALAMAGAIALTLAPFAVWWRCVVLKAKQAGLTHW